MSNELPVLYTTKDIQQIFKCGKNRAYDIMNSKTFPSFRIGNKLYVEKEELNKWLRDGKKLKSKYLIY